MLPPKIDNITEGPGVRELIDPLAEDGHSAVAELEPVDGLGHVEGAVDDLEPLDVVAALIIVIGIGGIDDDAHGAGLGDLGIVVEELVEGLEPLFCFLSH